MTNETIFRTMIALGGVFLGIILTIVISFWFTSGVRESPQQAYERGKIDGQVLEIRLQGNYDEEAIGVYIDCIHLLNSFKYSLLNIDSTDTMPAVEGDTMTIQEGRYLLNTE